MKGKIKLILCFLGLMSVSVINFAQVPYIFKNTSSVNDLTYSDDEIYIYPQLASSTGQIYFNTTSGEWEGLNTAPTFTGPDGNTYTNANMRLDQLPKDANGQYFVEIPQSASGRLYIGFGEPVYTVGFNNPLLDSPGDPNYLTKIETIELTIGGQIFTNTSRVDRYAYPIGEELYCNSGGFYDRVGETVSHEQVIAKFQLFVNDDFQNSYDPVRDIITQMGHSSYFQEGNPGNDYFDEFLDDFFTYYTTHTLTASYNFQGDRERTGHVVGDVFFFDDPQDAFPPFEFHRDDFDLEDISGGDGPFSGPGNPAAQTNDDNYLGQVLGVCLNRGVVILTEDVQHWDDESLYFRNPVKNDYTHFFHSDFVSYEARTYALAFDDVFDYSSTQSCAGTADSVVLSLGGFGTEHEQILTDVYITPLNAEVDQFRSLQLEVNGLDQGLIDVDISSDAVITWTVKDPSGTIVDLIDENGLFGPTDITGDYEVTVTVESDGDTFTETIILPVNPAGTTGEICSGSINSNIDYTIEMIGRFAFLTLEPTPTWTEGGGARIHFGETDQLNQLTANIIIPNQPFLLDGFFQGDEVYFFILTDLNGGSTTPERIEEIGTCDGLEVLEQIVNLQVTENVTIDDTETYQIDVVGISNASNSFNYPNDIFTEILSFSGIGVDANGLFTPINGTGDYEVQVSYDGILVTVNINVTGTTCTGTLDLGEDKEICEGENINISFPTGTYTDISWSGTGSTHLNNLTSDSPIFDATIDGSFELSVTAKDNSGCDVQDDIRITVNENPILDLTANPTEVCNDVSVLTLEATPTGGVFSGAGISGNTFDPSLIDAGNSPFTIAYNYTDPSTGCEAEEETFEIEVNETPLASGIDVSSQNDLIIDQSSVPDLCVTGDNVMWYATNDKTETAIFSGTCYSVPFIDINPADGLMDEGTYTFYASQTQNGCESELVAVTLSISSCPTIVLGTDKEICEGEDITINLPTGTFTNITWSGSGENHLNDLSSNTPIFTGDNSGAFNLVVSARDEDNSCDALGTINVIVNENPILDLTTNPTEVCNDVSVLTLEATPTGGVFSGAGISGNTFDPSLIDAGNSPFTIAYNYTDPSTGCEAEEETFEIEVNETPLASGIDVSSQNDLIIDQSSVPDLCVTGDNVMWYATNDKTETAIFSGTCYSVPFIDINPADGLMDDGTYTFYASQTQNGCESELIPVTLSISSCATEAPLSLNTSFTICEGDDLPILISNATGVNIEWTLDDQETIVGEDRELVLSSFGDQYTSVGTYLFYVSQENQIEGGALCRGPQTEIEVVVNEEPQVNITGATAICSGESLVLEGQTTGSIDQFIWSSGETDTNIINVSPLITSDYLLEVRTQAGCSAESEVTVEVIKQPEAEIITLNNIICNDESITLQASDDLNESYTFTWYNQNDEELGIGTTISINEPGSYKVKVINQRECESVSDEFTVINEIVEVLASVSKDTVQIEESVKLSALGSSNVLTYDWDTPAGTISGQEIEFVITENTSFTVEAKGITCSASSEVFVTVLEEFKIPNGFSPNDDGKNDVWRIPALALQENINVIIFNRIGEIVFETSSYETPWDGRNKNGNRLSPGTYFYVITTEDGTNYSADLTIFK